MKKNTHENPLRKIMNQLITNITSTSFQIIKAQLERLNDQQDLNHQDQVIQQNKVPPNDIPHQEQHSASLFLNHQNKTEGHQFNKDILHSQVVVEQQKIPSEPKVKQNQSQQLQSNLQKCQTANLPLVQPPNLPNKAEYLEQESMQRSSKKKEYSIKESQKQARKSSGDSSINLQLTQKTKKSRILSQSIARGDSLIYSDATLLYSNATGFGVDMSPAKIQTQSSKKLNKIEDEEAEIQARMSNTESQQYDRMKTESQVVSDKSSKKFKKVQVQKDNEQKIFSTEVNDFKIKIGKIKELKQIKKKKLEVQLRRINQQLQDLSKKQLDIINLPKINNFESRVKISDDAQAKVKAERLIKELRYEKKSRHEAHLGDLQVIDKNINNYMEELMKERYKNEERIKQRRQLEIIERMKQQEIRKIEEQKQKDKNVQFVSQLKNSNSKNKIPIKPTEQSINKKIPPNKQRSPTKKSEPNLESEISPSLSRKKAYLHKVRNISKGRQMQDKYEQVLM